MLAFHTASISGNDAQARNDGVDIFFIKDALQVINFISNCLCEKI